MISKTSRSAGEAGVAENLRHERRVEARLELSARNIDGQKHTGPRRAPGPAHRIDAGRAQYVEPHVDDQAGLLGHVDELTGHDQTAFRVLPAYERLGAGHLAAAKVDDRLEVHHELVAADGLAQVGLDGYVSLCALGHFIREVVTDITAHFLGVVHGHVGVAQQLIGVVGIVRRHRDADARACVDQVSIEHEWFRQGVDDLLGDGGRLIDVAEVLQQYRKLVTAEASDCVGGAQAFGHPVGRADQELVADVVTKCVVDVLETIQIDEQHRHRAAGASRALDGAIELLTKAGTVRQSGQGVVVGAKPEVFFDTPQFRDVGVNADHATLCSASLVDPDDAIVAMGQLETPPPSVLRAESFIHPLARITVDLEQPGANCVLQQLFEAHARLQSIGQLGVKIPVAGIAQHETIVGIPQRETIADRLDGVDHSRTRCCHGSARVFACMDLRLQRDDRQHPE